MRFQKTSPIKGILLINFAVIAIVFFLFSGLSHASFSGKQTVFASFLKLPLAFEKNDGQTDATFNYFSRANEYTLFFAAEEIAIALKTPLPPVLKIHNSLSSNAAQDDFSLLTMKFLGTNKSSQTAGVEILPGKSHYLLGNDIQKWHLDKAHYAKIQYKNLYPKIDAVFSGNQQLLKYDLYVAAGADPDKIRLAIHGQEEMYLDKSGDLFFKSAQRNLAVMKKPRLYQIIHNIKQEVKGNYKIYDEQQVGFTLTHYDKTKPLLIEQDISLAQSGGGNDIAKATAVDKEGNIYVTGESTWASLQTSELKSLTRATVKTTKNAFVAKLNSAGNALLYSTYFGGSDGSGAGNSIAIDYSGHAYITGQTTAVDFPTTPGALQIIHSGEKSAFITKLNPEGNKLVYSTYLGGEGSDKGNSIAVDSFNHAYIAGQTTSLTFPTTPGAYQTALMGHQNAFISILNNTGSELIYSTYLGGEGRDLAKGIAINASGNVYVTGQTSSRDFPVTIETLQKNLEGRTNAFISQIHTQGNGLIYSSYLGGEGNDKGNGIAIDSVDNVYITGQTSSTNFPVTAEAFQKTLQGATNAFISKLDTKNNTLIYSTYLGGESHDAGNEIIVDALNQVYVIGQAASTNFPVTTTALQIALRGIKNAFISKFNDTGSILIYSSYFDRNNYDLGNTITIDSNQTVPVTDKASYLTNNGVLALAEPEANTGYADTMTNNDLLMFLLTVTTSKIDVSCFGGANGSATVTNVTGGPAPYTYSWAPSGGIGVTATGLAAGPYTVTVTASNTDTGIGNVTINQPAAALNNTSFQSNVSCNGGSNGLVGITVSGGTPPYTYAWTPNGGTTSTISGLTAGPQTVTIRDANTCLKMQSFTITQPPALNIAPSQINVSCNGGNTGSATVNVTGGTGAYTYAWTPSVSTGPTATGLTAGNYSVTVTDTNGCPIVQNFTIMQPPALNATSSQTNVTCFGGSNGTATVNATGGITPYTYAWTPSGGSAATATGLSAGNYVVTISDANLCPITRNFTLMQPAAIAVTTTSQTNVSCNGGNNGSATVSATGGSGGYTYAWAPIGGTAPTATGLSAGIYTVTVTDSSGCSGTQTVTITQPTAINPSISPSSPSINLGDSVVLTGTQGGGTPPYSYLWSTGATTNSISVSPTSTTVYNLAVTDNNSCMNTVFNTVTVVNNSGGTADVIVEPYKKQPPRISLKRMQLVTAALTGSANFNISQVDRRSLFLEDAPVQISPNGQPRCTLEPLNGRVSLLCWFKVLKNSRLSKVVGCPTTVALTGAVGSGTFSATAVICAVA